MMVYLLLIFTPLPKGSVQGWAITLIHIVTLIALFCFALEKIVFWDGRWIKTPLDKPLFFLFLLCLASALTSVHQGLSFRALVEFFNYIAIYYLIIQVFNNRKHFQSLVWVIVAVAAFLAVFGLFKWVGAKPFSWWDYPGQPEPQHFLTSTYFNYNHLAGYLEMIIPLLLGLLTSGLKKKKLIFCLIVLAFLATALILSLSRGGWIGALTGSAFFCLAFMYSRHSLNLNRGFLILTSALLILGIIALSSTTPVERLITFEQKEKIGSFQSRVNAWKGIPDLVRDYPFLGSGPGTFSTIFTRYQPPGFWVRFFNAHNDYLQFISEVGLFWIPIILWCLFMFFRSGLKKLKDPSRMVRGLTAGSMAGVVSIMVHSFSDFNLHISANALLFAVITAIATTPAFNREA